MSGGVRETICSKCDHRDVCAHKERYLGLLKTLRDNYSLYFAGMITDNFSFKEPECKHYKHETNKTNWS